MTGIILLAAGGSSRLGTPKQALTYQGQTFLQQAASVALASGFSPVVVVLGHMAQQLSPCLEGLPVVVAVNEVWQEGMAGSITSGLNALLELSPNLENAIILLCDQPFVDASVLQALGRKHVETGKGIVACAYGQTVGTPALFHCKYFPDLFALEGPHGAKKLLTKFAQDVEVLAFPQGAIDIDTPEEYDLLLRQVY